MKGIVAGSTVQPFIQALRHVCLLSLFNHGADDFTRVTIQGLFFYEMSAFQMFEGSLPLY